MPSETITQARSRRRDDIPERFKWNLNDIYPDWSAWEAAYKKLEAGIDRYAALKGTLSEGPHRLLEAFQLSEELDQLAYRVWYYPSLQYDEDQRDNTVNARRSRCSSCSRGGSRRSRGSAPSCLRFRSRPCAWMDARPERSGSTASRSKISIASRSTSSTRRASG